MSIDSLVQGVFSPSGLYNAKSLDAKVDARREV
jgi:hypothetical protein